MTNAEFAGFLQKLGGTSNARGQHLFDWDDGDARIHRRQGQWRADPGFENHPANEMTWYGARDYCAALGKRLPTEAEREFAARGREGRTYPWGEAPPDPTRAPLRRRLDRDRAGRLLPAGATPEGVLDLAGNVHEWTSSIMRPYPYRADDGREDSRTCWPIAWCAAARLTPDRTRCARAGAARACRAAARAGHHNIGFRCVRDAD